MKTAKSLVFSSIVAGLIWLSPHRAHAQDRVWTNRGPAGVTGITGVALDPANPLVLYATSDAGGPGTSGIRKSLDGGQTWIELGAGDADLASLACVTVDPSNSSNVYLGSASGLVASSHDGGAAWSKATISTNPVSAIAVAADSGRVYAATRGTGYYDSSVSYGTAVSVSGDAGGTWQASSLASPRGVYALLADAFPGTLLAGTDFAYHNGYYGGQNPTGGGVATSDDAGGTWTLPPVDLGFSITVLTKVPQSPLVLAATSSGQLLQSEDGASWTPLATLPGTLSAIAIDPADPTTMYAGLVNGGLWRSVDGGRTWSLFDSGLADASVRALAVDPTGRHLYAATQAGLLHRELSTADTSPCRSGSDHLCLLGSRFRVDLYAVDPNTHAAAPVRALPKGDRFGYFSFPSLTSDATLPEVFVKMLDATSLPGQGYWLFSTSLTNVAYSLVVTDTTDGRVRIYDGQAFCGTADIHAFPAAAPGPASARTGRSESSAARAESELALLSGRFRITLSATNPFTGSPVTGVAIPQGDRFGYFSLPDLTGDPTFPEVFVKMLDATSLPDDDFWLFQSGLTSVPYALTVTDTASGASKTYRNDPIDPARLCGSADTRVTSGPTPTSLTGDWVEELGENDATATVAHQGSHLSFVLATPFGTRYTFDGTLAGSLTGALRVEFNGCHFEGAASGYANSSTIEISAIQPSSTCGALYFDLFFHLTPAPEGDSRVPNDR